MHRTHPHPLAAIPLALVLAVSGCAPGPASEEPAPEPDEMNTANVLDREEMTQPVAHIEELFAGRIAGVLVRRAGGRVWVEIRGPSTFSGSNEALIVIDGVQTMANGLMSLNPDDIERIEVLKGASAAVYGVRGANGVLLITTRRNE